MKKIYLSLVFNFLFIIISFSQGQLINDSLFSDALGKFEQYQIYLPENYDAESSDGYQVIYFLHGSLNDHTSYGFIIPILDSLISNGIIQPTILVKPNGSQGSYGGSMYTNSALNGNVEDFIMQDLIPYIDNNYNTKIDRQFRSIMGHSMGANGAGRLSLAYPETFRAFGAHSGTPDINLMPLFLDWVIFNAFSTSLPPYEYSPFGWPTFLFIASSGWSPNLDNLPYQVDLPIDSLGFPIDSILKVWSNFTEAQIVSKNPDIGDLAIFFDCGIQDQFQFFPLNEAFRDTLVKHKIPHTFQYYEGGHGDKLLERFPISLTFLDSVMNAGITNAEDLGAHLKNIAIFPNPSFEELQIELNLPETSQIQIEILSSNGQLVETLLSRTTLFQGIHFLSFSPHINFGGSYFIRFTINNQIFSKNWTYIKN